LSNTATVSYQWEIKGRQPKIKQKQRNRERRTVFGCVEPGTGKVVYQVSERGNAKTFFSFLVKVVKAYQGNKVYMVLDNVAYHHSKRIKAVLERYSHKLELIFLPPYSPDLNPVERIWWFMRKKISHNRYLQTMEQRLELLEHFMTNFAVENEQGKVLSNICSEIN
jgi:transposase